MLPPEMSMARLTLSSGCYVTRVSVGDKRGGSVVAGSFAGPSEMHQRVAALGWAATSVGPVDRWPQSLRATIKTLLGSRYPMILLWGPDLIQIYNDAYIGLIGDKHPGALGRSIRETQAESWEVIGPMINEVMSTGIPNWVPAQRLPLERAGYREESYFSLSYSAVDDDDGRISGMLCVCSEVTQQVLGERRTRLLRDLALKAGDTRSVDAICGEIATTMAAHPLDVPFALLSLRTSEGTFARCAAVGLPEKSGGHALADPPTDADDWPLGRAASGETVLVEDVQQRIELTGGPWNDAVRAALVMPIASAEPGVSLGVLVAGVSPNRALDEGYSSFYELLGCQVSIAIRNARAYEDARRRAEGLAELDRAKTAFFSNISHELRTPLTLMLGPIEDLLSKGRLGHDERRELEMVHRNARRLLRLVNTLLDFSRIEAGRTDAIFQPVDLGRLTADLASSFRPAVERAGLTLTVDCPEMAQPAFVDRDMWEKIVLNLLSNALKFTFDGGITVRLRQTDGRAALEVIDTGTGIPSAEVPHLFERFHRVRAARSRTHEGTGIGLALVHELVKLHGGEVTMTSTEGKGTAFTVTVPLGSAHLPKERVRTSPGAAAADTSADMFAEEALRWLPAASEAEHPAGTGGAAAVLAGKPPVNPARGHILIVEDNADMRAYLARVLEPSFQVVTVEDGQAALDMMAEGRRIDLVLTDVMMPRLSGFDLLKALRSDPRTRAIPVVMLSARAGEETSIEGLEAGADDYLIKPFSARELVARTRSALDLARMRKEVAALEVREASLAESLRVRDEFLAVASHELKTPLTPLRLHLDSIRKSAHGAGPDLTVPKLGSKLEVIGRQVNRLETLVNSLLDVARLASQRLELTCEDTDLAEVVRDVAAQFAVESKDKRCSLELDLPAHVVGRWDRPSLEQIATHLIRNAIKFGAGAPVTVAVDAGNDWARLVVRDRGIGIAPEDQARIFGRFERAASTDHYGGLGLGLWIVRQVIDALGGAVTIESGVGEGSAFTVKLPLRRAVDSLGALGGPREALH